MVLRVFGSRGNWLKFYLELEEDIADVVDFLPVLFPQFYFSH